jgi:hypothetical protein
MPHNERIERCRIPWLKAEVFKRQPCSKTRVGGPVIA